MRKGFTLLEMLIVIGISGMLSAIAIVYSSVARNQVALSVETAKIADVILSAKSLAITTYAQGGVGTACGYGAAFNVAANTYSVFAYEPKDYPPEHDAAPPCPDNTIAELSPIHTDEMVQYSPSTWNTPLANGVKFEDGGSGDDLYVVLFYPPNPDTFISRDAPGGAPQTFLDPAVVNPVTSKVYLITADGSASAAISVNGAGQVTF